MKFLIAAIPAAVLVMGAAHASAQSMTGNPLQENGPKALTPPTPSNGITLPGVQTRAPLAGGEKVTLTGIVIRGNRSIPTPTLMSAIGGHVGETLDFAGLSAIAETLSEFYHHAGFPLARAYLPPQDLGKQTLLIDVVEGSYGKVRTKGKPTFATAAQRFLGALQTGSPIESAPLERAVLILNDQPGVKIMPVLSPGDTYGSGDLTVDVQRDHYVSGEVGLDNFGSRYAGKNRAHVDLDVDSPLMLGDQLALQGLYTDEHMWFGSAGYSLPIGASGLRGRVSYTHSYYELGGNFSSLDATGTADVASAGVSYPLVRSQQRNVTLIASIQHKQLHDDQLAGAESSHRSSDALPLEVDFDVRDSLLGGALTYGTLTWTSGDLKLADDLESADAQTAHTAGRFGKANLDVARIQSLSSRIDLYMRFSAQWSTGNLDSSEKFGLGGINGVRAYPAGEGYGDEGWLGQVELRYSAGAFGPYVFYDAGSVAMNHSPWTAGNNHRSLGGTGGGLRYLNGHWSGNLVVAWRTSGGAPTSDTRHGTPLVWAGAQYRF